MLVLLCDCIQHISEQSRSKIFSWEFFVNSITFFFSFVALWSGQADKLCCWNCFVFDGEISLRNFFSSDLWYFGQSVVSSSPTKQRKMKKETDFALWVCSMRTLSIYKKMCCLHEAIEIRFQIKKRTSNAKNRWGVLLLVWKKKKPWNNFQAKIAAALRFEKLCGKSLKLFYSRWSIFFYFSDWFLYISLNFLQIVWFIQ